MSGPDRSDPLPGLRDDLALFGGYHSPQLDVAVRLNTNEAPDPPPAAFVDAVAEAVRDVRWNRYPDRSAAVLRRRIAGHHGVDPGRVFAANGSNEVLQCLLVAYTGAGRRVVVFEPTYALHSHIARLVGAEVVTGERTPDFEIDPGAAADLVVDTQPHVVFLCSPNNPTGVVEPAPVLAAVLGAARTVGALVVVDEAYGQFASSTAIEMVDDVTPLVVTRTFSKTWSMAAARLGYAVAPRRVVADLETVVLPYHLDAVTQLAGALAFDHVDEMEARVGRLVAERRRLVEGLGRLDVDQWPSGANFVLFRPRRVAGAEVWQRLLDRSILVRNCSDWPRLEDCLRATVGTPAENTSFLDALAEILA